MKAINHLLVLITLAAMAGAATAADVTGKWNSEFTSPIGRLKYIYDLKAEGEKLTGKAIRELDGQKAETEIKEGMREADRKAIEESKKSAQ